MGPGKKSSGPISARWIVLERGAGYLPDTACRRGIVATRVA